jgi:protein gp37
MSSKPTPQHEYQVLTKRAEEMLRYSRRRKLPSNFWAGVSIEDQARAFRADILRQGDAEIRFVSAEPLLGPLVLEWSAIHWRISGGEAGRHLFDPKLLAKRALVDYERGRWGAREDRIAWVRSLRDQCLSAGVKYFHKQWGGFSPKSAGRLLDGRTWDEFPRLPGGKQAITNPHLR